MSGTESASGTIFLAASDSDVKFDEKSNGAKKKSNGQERGDDMQKTRLIFHNSAEFWLNSASVTTEMVRRPKLVQGLI